MAQHEVGKIRPGDLRLQPDELQWVQSKWDKVRRSNQRADAADNQWNKINDEINDLFRREGVTDILDRAKRKNESIALKDALDVGKWHSANAQRHIDDVQLFLKLKEHGML